MYRRAAEELARLPQLLADPELYDDVTMDSFKSQIQAAIGECNRLTSVGEMVGYTPTIFRPFPTISHPFI